MAAWLGRAWGWRSRVNATLVLLIAAGLVAFLGVSVVSNYTAAGDAVSSLVRPATRVPVTMISLPGAAS